MAEGFALVCEKVSVLGLPVGVDGLIRGFLGGKTEDEYLDSIENWKAKVEAASGDLYREGVNFIDVYLDTVNWLAAINKKIDRLDKRWQLKLEELINEAPEGLSASPDCYAWAINLLRDELSDYGYQFI